MIFNRIIKSLEASVSQLNYPTKKIIITPPNNSEFGDLSTNIPLLLSKEVGIDPLEIGRLIIENLNIPKDLVCKVSLTKPGFINFKIDNKYYFKILSQILNNPEYGKGIKGKGKTANVEFVSANPTGPLTVGHGRNAVLGDTVSNILEWNGYDVTREYYFNNAGRQMRVLSQSVEARYFQLLGIKNELPDDGYEGAYIIDIAKSIRKEFGDKLATNDPIFKEKPEEVMFNDIKDSLLNLGIDFDCFTNEKSFYENGEIEKLVDQLKTKGLIYTKDGATWFKTSNLGKEKDRVYIKSTGEPTYRVPDTAYHKNKIDRGFDLIVDVFGADHTDTYPDVLLALNAIGLKTDHIRVLLYQFVTLLRDGKKIKMSTRKANFVTLDELVNELGTDVVRYFFIMRGMSSHLNFDLSLAADQSDKNPVFYLQYAHARICNIIKNNKKENDFRKNGFSPELLTHNSEINLLKILEQFPSVVEKSLDSLEPQNIVHYLNDIASRFHKFYADCKVLSDDLGLTRSRIALISSTKIVIGNGLNLLGIKAPEKM